MNADATETLVLPPVPVPDDAGRLWYSVQVTLPHDADQAIQEFVEAGGGRSWTTAVHGALYGYRATLWTKAALQAELIEALQEAMREETIEVTPEFWKELVSRGKANVTYMRALKAAGMLGNLLLPRELYEFIANEIACGSSKTPTDVVCAAMPYLRATEPS